MLEAGGGKPSPVIDMGVGMRVRMNGDAGIGMCVGVCAWVDAHERERRREAKGAETRREEESLTERAAWPRKSGLESANTP